MRLEARRIERTPVVADAVPRPDNRGVPLEVLAIELSDGDLLVIHAMRMRSKCLDDYERVMQCL